MAELVVRPAVMTDLPGVLALYQHLNPGDAAPLPDIAEERFQAIISQPGMTVWIGLIGNEPICSATLIVIPNLTRGGAPYALIENVVTHADHRGKGYGSSLVKHAIAAAGDAGCYKVMLLTGRSDPAILEFYKSCGFTQDKTGFQVRFDR